MAYTVELYPAQPCNFKKRSLPQDPSAARLVEYLQPFTTPPLRYRVTPGAHLVGQGLTGLEGRRRRPIADTLPFENQRVAPRFGFKPLSSTELFKLRCLSLLPNRQHLHGTICSLIDRRAWQNNYFHWFIDTLPRVLAAEDHQNRTGRPVRLLVPSQLFKWQRASLDLLGWQGERLIAISPVDKLNNLYVDELVSCCARGAGYVGDAPLDAIAPDTLLSLRERFGKTIHPSQEDSPKRIYISRADAPGRCIANEEEIMRALSKYGFQKVRLSETTLQEQIALFRSATHIIAPHGAGLTNILHAREAKILEIFQPLHGLRPDFLQIAIALGHHYAYLAGSTVKDHSDIHINTDQIESWLDSSL